MMDSSNEEERARETDHPQTLFHTVGHNPPQESDFWSNEREGKRQPREAWQVRYWRGFSAFDTFDQARNKAISFPRQGKFVAEIAVADIPGITYEQSFGPGHYTVWAEPAICAANVVAIFAVRYAPKGQGDEKAL